MTMTPGQRCDEIVRLIDETLSACPPVALPIRRPQGRAEAKLEEALAQTA
jgi:hypothetical protein